LSVTRTTAPLWALALVACASPYPWGHARIATDAREGRTIEITATRTAFSPNRIEVALGEIVRLRFVRTTSNRCAREVIVNLDGEHQLRRELPVNGAVELVLEFDHVGELGFSCGMAMLGGTITITNGLR
jgi:plastocyanin domain-containing protein